MVTIVLATEDDFGAFLELASEVEDLFGPMVDEPGFHDAVRRNIAPARPSSPEARWVPRPAAFYFLFTTIPPMPCAGLS